MARKSDIYIEYNTKCRRLPAITVSSLQALILLCPPRSIESFLVLTEHYTNDLARSADPVQEAFNDASKYFKESLTQDECKRVWLDGMNSLEDVSDVLLKAKEKYETSKKSRARVWLSKFSARVTHYGKIIGDYE